MKASTFKIVQSLEEVKATPIVSTFKTRIEYYRASDRPDIASFFHQQQVQVLKSIGVEGICSSQPNWLNSKNMHIFLARCVETGEVAGGMLLKKASTSKLSSVPMAEALRSISDDFNDLVARLKEYGLAEACGWWIRSNFRGKGLAKILLRAGVALAPKFGITHILAFPHQHTKGIMRSVGFTSVDTLTNNGTFTYPDERYQSTVVELNARTLHTLNKEERDYIHDLRQNPNQVVTDHIYPTQDTEIEYCLAGNDFSMWLDRVVRKFVPFRVR